MGKNLGVSVRYINTNKNLVADKESRISPEITEVIMQS